MTSDPPPDVPPALAEDVASHAGPAFDHVRAAGRAALAAGGPHYLAHYSGAVYDFALDVLDQPTCPSTPPGGVREACQRTGGLLAAAVEDLDDRLGAVRTGALIRTVLHSDKGAFTCVDIVPGEHVLGVVFEAATDGPLATQPLMAASDRVLSDLATEQRRELSLGSQYPGGYGVNQADDEAHVSGSGAAKIHVERDPDPSPLLSSDRLTGVEAVLVEALAPRDVHYLAVCARGRTLLSVDCLDHDDLGRFFVQLSVETRRAFYRRFSADLPSVIGRLTRISASVTGSRLLRLVLDVEQGAFFYYRLGRGVFLVGVTLDQARVGEADRRIADVACDRRALLQFGA
jgi:hypothetical protein